jgi:hypothetical protein
MDDRLRKPFIFIVYDKSELALAASLQELFEAWGCDTFQCGQSRRKHKDFRDDLRENLFESDLVVLLLSREFCWSQYCQAETGSAMVLDKPVIPIIVSPATEQEIESGEVAPVFAKYQCLFTADPDFVTKLESSLRDSLRERKTRLTHLRTRIQSLERSELHQPRFDHDEKDMDRRKAVESAVKHICEKYALYQPKKAISSVWPRLADEDCKESIVGNIRKSLEDRASATVLVFVGVSLKYSLKLIRIALAKSEIPSADKASTPKTLRITLVHMDSASYILHALGDGTDITSIRDSFDDFKWRKIYAEWQELCAERLIKLEEPILHRIDYIPPRVGLLIDDKFLYAGRCSIRPIGDWDVPMSDVHGHGPPGADYDPKFNLDVGENEYHFYQRDSKTRNNDPTWRAMREFKGFVVAYRQSKFNAGITPIWESDEWYAQLHRYISARKQSDEITFVSATSQRFGKLIKKALDVGAKVNIYLHDPDPSRKSVSAYTNWLRNGVGDKVARATILGYEHSPTFRAVIVGDVAIGLQPYTFADGEPGVAEKTGKLKLCFIISRGFNRFAELRDNVLESLTEPRVC